MPKCIIHVGMHKTGTTSIQKSLNNFIDDKFVFAQLGDHPNHSIPVFSMFSATPERHILNKFRASDPNLMAAYVEQMKDDFDRAIANAGDRTLIISGEEIANLKEGELALLERYLRPHCNEISILAYIRPPLSYMSSAFQQTVRSGRRVALNVENLYRNYRDGFEKFDLVFGKSNVILKKFDKNDLIEGDAVVDFCSTIGLNLPSGRIVRDNESTTRDLTRLLFQYNRYCKENDIEPASGSQMQEIATQLSKLGQAKFQLSRTLLEQVTSQKFEDISWMEQRLGVTLAEKLAPMSGSEIGSEKELLAPVSGARSIIFDALQKQHVEVGNADSLSDSELFHKLRIAIAGEIPQLRELVIRGHRGRDAVLKARQAFEARAANRRMGAKKGQQSGRSNRPRAIGPNVNRPKGPLGTGPRPLINIDKNFTVVWSPKAACTTVYAWFSHVSGFGGEVEAFGRRIHRHRITKYYSSELYERSLLVDPAAMRCLRIIRDPYNRAVSIYRHAMYTKFADKMTRAVAGSHFVAEIGYSFQQFLDVLHSIDITVADAHVRPQFHQYEKHRKPDHIINITRQDLFMELNSFETEMGLAKTNFDDLGWLHNIESKRKAPQKLMDGMALDRAPFTHNQVFHLGQFPNYDQLLTPEARLKIEAIYKADFEAYRDYL